MGTSRGDVALWGLRAGSPRRESAPSWPAGSPRCGDGHPLGALLGPAGDDFPDPYLHLGLPKSLSVTSAAPSPTVTPDPGREGASPGALAPDRSPSQLPRWGRGCQERCPRGSSSSCPHSAAVQQTRLVLGAVNSYTHVVPPFTELMRSQRWGPLPGGTRAYERTGQDGAMGSRDSAVGRRVGAGAEPPRGLPTLTAREDSPVP